MKKKVKGTDKKSRKERGRKIQAASDQQQNQCYESKDTA